MKFQNSNHKTYDLEERTGKFGEAIIDFVKKIKPDHINRPIIDQLVRASTSIGANYMEANGAESKRDFLHKIGICKKESKESKHFLRMIARSNPKADRRIKKALARSTRVYFDFRRDY